MKSRNRQSGFAILEVLLVVVVVALIGFLGYAFYLNQQKQMAKDQQTSESAVANDTQSAPDISSTADLDNASKILDETDPAGSNVSDATSLSSQSADFQ